MSAGHGLPAVLVVYKGGDATLCSATACVFIDLPPFAHEVFRKRLDDRSMVHRRSKVCYHGYRLDILQGTFTNEEEEYYIFSAGVTLSDYCLLFLHTHTKPHSDPDLGIIDTHTTNLALQ